MKLYKSIFLIALFCIFAGKDASAKLTYHVDFLPDHYMKVNLMADSLISESTAFELPVWAPGYYLICDFPKNVTDFTVTTSSGQPLAWQKEGKGCWIVQNNKENVVNISYLVYADALSVAESQVENDRAFVAPNGVFMYKKGHKDENIEMSFSSKYPKVSTGLPKTAAPFTFVASNIDQLYDSPLLFGNHKIIEFDLEGHHYEMAFETPQGLEKTNFVEDMKKVISQTSKMMGHVPYDNYCFLFMKRGQGGLEHCNSQADFTDGDFEFSDSASYFNFLSFVTHEYFHLYNVKTIRPIELGPFDYTQEVFTPSLWISEGFTVYYETALMRNAGLVDGDYILKDMSNFIKSVENEDGHSHMNLRESSYDIWLNFFNRNGNRKEKSISYYDKGPILGLLMDIRIRHLTENKQSLDDVMRALYNTYYLKDNRGFTEEEFWNTCENVAGKPLTEMRKYVETTAPIDYMTVLAEVGLEADQTPLPNKDKTPDGLIRKSWKLQPMKNCTESAAKIRKSMFGL